MQVQSPQNSDTNGRRNIPNATLRQEGMARADLSAALYAYWHCTRVRILETLSEFWGIDKVIIFGDFVKFYDRFEKINMKKN